MAYTVSSLKTDLEGSLHGTSLSQVQGVDNLINRAARDVLGLIDPRETKKQAQIANALYDNVFDYAAPSDLKGDRVIDIRPQINRGLGDNFSQTYSEQFDLKKKGNTFQVEHNNGTKFLRIAKDVGDKLVLDRVNGITDNGTWSAAGNAENLEKDTNNYLSGGASLKFDLDGTGTIGWLTNSTLTSVDLTEHEDISSIFLWLFIPDTSIFTNVTLRWGSDSSNYWTTTETSPHFGSVETGWNLFRHDWNGASVVNSPDSSDVTFVRVLVQYDGTADTDFRLDNIISRRGDIFEILYYSKYLFRDATSGDFQEEVGNDTDEINLDTESYNLLFYRTLYLAAHQVAGQDSGFDTSFADNEWTRISDAYTRRNPSEAEKPRQTYYRFPNKFRKTRGQGWIR